MNTQKSVNKKLFGNTPKSAPKKRKFKKSRKVSLSKIGEIYDKIYIAYTDMEYALDQFIEIKSEMIGIRDILRFALDDIGYGYASDELDLVVEQLEELGVDIPSEIQDALDVREKVIEKHNELINEFDNFGVNPMTDRL